MKGAQKSFVRLCCPSSGLKNTSLYILGKEDFFFFLMVGFRKAKTVLFGTYQFRKRPSIPDLWGNPGTLPLSYSSKHTYRHSVQFPLTTYWSGGMMTMLANYDRGSALRDFTAHKGRWDMDTHSNKYKSEVYPLYSIPSEYVRGYRISQLGRSRKISIHSTSPDPTQHPFLFILLIRASH